MVSKTISKKLFILTALLIVAINGLVPKFERHINYFLLDFILTLNVTDLKLVASPGYVKEQLSLTKLHNFCAIHNVQISWLDPEL